MTDKFSVINPYQYREIRTSYCKNMFCDLYQKLNLSGDERILDIGAGTGQSSDFFIHKKFDVTLLEPNYSFAQYLDKLYKEYRNVNIINCKYEDALFTDENFDLVIAGTSCHWLNKNQKYKLLYKHLRENGFLVLFWSRPNFFCTDIGKRIMTILQKYICDGNAKSENFSSEIMKQLKEIRDSKLFKCISLKTYEYREKYDCKAVSDLLNTSLDVCNLKLEKKSALLAEIKQYMEDKNLDLLYYVDMYICEKREV